MPASQMHPFFNNFHYCELNYQALPHVNWTCRNKQQSSWKRFVGLFWGTWLFSVHVWNWSTRLVLRVLSCFLFLYNTIMLRQIHQITFNLNYKQKYYCIKDMLLIKSKYTEGLIYIYIYIFSSCWAQLDFFS